MDGFLLASLSCLWFGILTSISPCPLATNIVATTYIGKQIQSRNGALLAGLAYALGRMAAYALLCVLVVKGLLSIPGVSMFLQRHMNQVLGPVLILAGLLVLKVIPLPMPDFGVGDTRAKRLAQAGAPGAVFLGFLFALSFCPISAALFFGSVIPLSLKFQSLVWLPLSYGIGTAAPVILFACALAASTRLAGRFLKGIARVERPIRWITGAVFVLTGCWFCLKFLLGVIA